MGRILRSLFAVFAVLTFLLVYLMLHRVEPPEYLYKVVSLENWEASRDAPFVKLDSIDSSFISLATEEQVEGVIEEYWTGTNGYAVLKLDTEKLDGKLILEANPGEEKKVYRLYDGGIPMIAVVCVTTEKP